MSGSHPSELDKLLGQYYGDNADEDLQPLATDEEIDALLREGTERLYRGIPPEQLEALEALLNEPAKTTEIEESSAPTPSGASGGMLKKFKQRREQLWFWGGASAFGLCAAMTALVVYLAPHDPVEKDLHLRLKVIGAVQQERSAPASHPASQRETPKEPSCEEADESCEKKSSHRTFVPSSRIEFRFTPESEGSSPVIKGIRVFRVENSRLLSLEVKARFEQHSVVSVLGSGQKIFGSQAGRKKLVFAFETEHGAAKVIEGMSWPLNQHPAHLSLRTEQFDYILVGDLELEFKPDP